MLTARLNIEQQFASVGIKVTPAQMSITTKTPKMKIVDNGMPDFETEYEEPDFKLNWGKVYDDMGLKRPKSFNAEVTGKARAKTYEAMGTAASEGNYLGKVEQGDKGARTGQIAKNRNMTGDQREINVGLVPGNSPEVNWKPGSVSINWSDHRFTVEWEGDYRPEITVDPLCSVEIFLRNRPYVKISVEDLSDPHMGNFVDAVF